MSLESWKQEYYPVPADEVSKEDAVKHSLQKWIGLRAENRIRHGVQLYDGELTGTDTDELSIDSSSCALCHHYLREVDDTSCTDCPLAAALGQSCDELGEPYNIFKGPATSN